MTTLKWTLDKNFWITGMMHWSWEPTPLWSDLVLEASALPWGNNMTTKSDLERAHKIVASVAGRLSLAIVARTISRGDLRTYEAELCEAIEVLRRVAIRPGSV